MILGNRSFIDVPGSKTHELPPLLVRTRPAVKKLDRVMQMAAELIEQDDLIPFIPLHAEDFSSDGFREPRAPLDAGANAALERDLERRRMDMAVHLTEQYLNFVAHWRWGHDILEWIRQCETTFEGRLELRNLLRADLWPHAGRASFVTLLEDKHVDQAAGSGQVDLEKAVGLRLTFRQPPPLNCFSNQFLIYLRGSLADTAYRTWADIGKTSSSSFPPERFHFDVVNMSLE